MSRYIDADALTKRVEDSNKSAGLHLEDLRKIRRWIKTAPSIDIEPKRGEWICHKGGWIDFDYYPTKYECNQCHHYVDVASDKNFCPNCGADMRERESE